MAKPWLKRGSALMGALVKSLREPVEASSEPTEDAHVLVAREAAVREKEGALALRDLDLSRRDREILEREAAARARETESAALLSASRKKLETIAGLNAETAQKRLVDELLDDVRRRSAKEALAIEAAAKNEAEKRAKRILGIAIQRYASDQVHERATTTVHLPTDEMKGRIIGREGRNIRALQEATGVDILIDDTPETIVLACFDPVRREIARLSLETLIADGRIHPTRITEVVRKSEEELATSMRQAAEHAADELGLARIAPEILGLVGKLRHRYSYAQNVLRHSTEVGHLAGVLAGELGLDVQLARRAGFLHDIGKAISQETEGGHAVVGGRFAREHGEDAQVANAIASHHDDEPQTSVYAHLVAAADALSGARPGARREMLESYVKRLGDLERIANAFEGVQRSYAIQAGREVRVVVEPSEVTDEEAALLAREISKRIEADLIYPGQIRVTVVRETRAVDYAK